MQTKRDRPIVQTRWFFRDRDESSEERARRAWAEWSPRLERLLTAFPPEQRGTLLTVRHDDRTPQNQVHAVLILPAATIVAAESADDVAAAVKRVARTLVEEIKRHKELVREARLQRRKSRRREVLDAAEPLLMRDAEMGRSEDFYDLLRPLLGTLREHARRELRIAERNGALPKGQVTVDDLIDELVHRAWRRFKERPRWVALDLWLIGLLHQVLNEWPERVPPPHAGGKPRRLREEEEWFMPLFGGEEDLEWEHLLPGCDGDPAPRLEADEQLEPTLALLSQLPPMQRGAFALRLQEGYEADDIATIQGRDESKVLADIEAARWALVGRLHERDARVPAQWGPATASLDGCHALARSTAPDTLADDAEPPPRQIGTREHTCRCARDGDVIAGGVA
jgi:DNA-directed RNA polymerase specialized sigma24 family protein/ribosome-associated translation inhibitor RaiA